MAKHLKFLGKAPKFYGLTLQELMLLCVLVYLGAFLDFNPLLTIGLAIGLFSVFKYLTIKLDIVGLVFGSKQNSFEWFNDFNRVLK